MSTEHYKELRRLKRFKTAEAVAEIVHYLWPEDDQDEETILHPDKIAAAALVLQAHIMNQDEDGDAGIW